jgi:hypothetical protein
MLTFIFDRNLIFISVEGVLKKCSFWKFSEIWRSVFDRRTARPPRRKQNQRFQIKQPTTFSTPQSGQLILNLEHVAQLFINEFRAYCATTSFFWISSTTRSKHKKRNDFCTFGNGLCTKFEQKRFGFLQKSLVKNFESRILI